MKQLIYSTGVFETELKVWPPEEVDDYDFGNRPWRTIQRNPRFQVRKTSHCLMRYEIEEGDDSYLHKLDLATSKAKKAVLDGVGTREAYQLAFDTWAAACKIYEKAINKWESGCQGVRYIEIADESERGCQAIYRFNDGITQCDRQVRIGEPLVTHVW